MIHEHDWMFTKQRKFKYCSILYFYCRNACNNILNKVIPPIRSSDDLYSVDDLGRVTVVKKEESTKMVGNDTDSIIIKPRQTGKRKTRMSPNAKDLYFE